MNIVLIGFMGSGKTSVAKSLAKKLKRPHLEMDDVILDMAQKSSINEIFEKFGEEYFRSTETEVAKKIANISNHIISTGGGIINNRANIDALQKNGKIIYLEASFPEIRRRLKETDDRPLFKNMKKAKALYAKRLSLYKSYSDFSVITDDKNIDIISEEIISIIN
jgi:shikimate kinase